MGLMWKNLFQERCMVIAWKADNKKNHPMSLCHNLRNTLNTYIVILVAFILQYKKAINSILVSKMV